MGDEVKALSSRSLHEAAGRSDAPPRRMRVDRPRRSLQSRLVLWTLALVVFPTFACGFWLNHIARDAMAQRHGRSVELLGLTIAQSLSGKVEDGWSGAAGDVIDGLGHHPGLAVVNVTDGAGALLHRRVKDGAAWSAMLRASKSTEPSKSNGASGAGRGQLGRGHATLLGAEHEVAVATVPIPGNRVVVVGADNAIDSAADTDTNNATATASDDGDPAAGYVTLAMRAPEVGVLRGRLEMAQLGAMAAICVVMLPVVIIAVGRWTRPIRGMLGAIDKLAREQRPDPVPEGSPDELGMLARAFNDMASKLSDALRDLARYNHQLEAMVGQRTQQLEQANHRLEREITDKNEFLRSVSHDLGTPLRNIDGMAKMLMMKYRAQLADDARAKLERISANARRQTELINDLLELSKLRTRPGRKDAVDLQQLVGDLLTSMDFDLKGAGIKAEIAGELPTIYAEPTRIRQVFQNLLDNAVKYMLDAPERRITVEAGEDAAAYRFAVIDTGPGIAKQDQPQVFQVFQRAVHSGSHRVEGRGVGLASVKSIVESYGGTVAVDSELGRGAAMRFTLAKSKVAAPAKERGAEESAPAGWTRSATEPASTAPVGV